MSGNVWEWCRTKWEGNYEDYENDNDLQGNARRVLRGGSFGNSAAYARCASRYGNDPNLQWHASGFQVVVAPFSPPSDL